MLSFYSSVIFSDPGDRDDIAKNTAKIIFSDPENENDIPKHTAKVDWLNFGTVLSYPGLITLAFPLTSTGFGLANFLFTIPAHRYIDGYHKKGRRLLLLVSLAGMFFSLVAISSFYMISDPDTRTGLVAVFTIVIYLAFYGIGAGPVPFTFSAEVFPLAFRGKKHLRIEITTSEGPLTLFLLYFFLRLEVGMSFSVMVNFIGLTILVTLVPLVNKYAAELGNTRPYGYLLYIFA